MIRIPLFSATTFAANSSQVKTFSYPGGAADPHDAIRSLMLFGNVNVGTGAERVQVQVFTGDDGSSFQKLRIRSWSGATTGTLRTSCSITTDMTGVIAIAQDTLARYLRVRVKNSGANAATVTLIGYGTAD